MPRAAARAEMSVNPKPAIVNAASPIANAQACPIAQPQPPCIGRPDHRLADERGDPQQSRGTDRRHDHTLLCGRFSLCRAFNRRPRRQMIDDRQP